MFLLLSIPISILFNIFSFVPLIAMMFMSHDAFLTCLIAIIIFSFVILLSTFGIYEGINLMYAYFNNIEEKKELMFVLFITTLSTSYLIILFTIIVCYLREYFVRKKENQSYS